MSHGGVLPGLEVTRPPRPAIGIRVDRNSSEAIITHIHQGGAADLAGIQVGDVITRFDGVEVRDADHLIELVKQRKPGDTVDVSLLRSKPANADESFENWESDGIDMDIEEIIRPASASSAADSSATSDAKEVWTLSLTLQRLGG